LLKQKVKVSFFDGGPLSNYQNLAGNFDFLRAILDHLESHPHAADTAEGVARWWLGGQGGASTLPKVETALRQLVARRVMREEKLADGTTLYSKNGRPMSSP
jgi:hypothetical protein